jgi:hypothetical protein
MPFCDECFAPVMHRGKCGPCTAPQKVETTTQDDDISWIDTQNLKAEPTLSDKWDVNNPFPAISTGFPELDKSTGIGGIPIGMLTNVFAHSFNHLAPLWNNLKDFGARPLTHRCSATLANNAKILHTKGCQIMILDTFRDPSVDVYYKNSLPDMMKFMQDCRLADKPVTHKPITLVTFNQVCVSQVSAGGKSIRFNANLAIYFEAARAKIKKNVMSFCSGEWVVV